jgi:hypothetical protein
MAGLNRSFVLTRLHARYHKDALGEDLVFRAAPPIMGGLGDVRQSSPWYLRHRTGGAALPEAEATAPRWVLPPMMSPPSSGGCAACRVGQGDQNGEAGDWSGISFIAIIAAATLPRRASVQAKRLSSASSRAGS